MGTYDIAGVLKWALGLRLKNDKVFMAEIVGATWYIDNYCARAVPTSCAYVQVDQAPPGLAEFLTGRCITEMDTELHDTGVIRKAEIKGRKNVCVWATEDGIEVGVREDYAKLIGKDAKLYAVTRDPRKRRYACPCRGNPGRDPDAGTG